MTKAARTATVAWLVTAVYYFYQYTLRSAPAVMMPQLVRGVRHHGAPAWRRWPASSTTATRRSAWLPVWRWTGSDRDALFRLARQRSASARCCSPAGNTRSRQRGPLHPGRGRCLRARRRGVHRDDQLPGLACRDAHRRHADVRHGRRLGRPVRRRADDRGRASAGARSGSGMGVAGLAISVMLFLLLPEPAAAKRAGRLVCGTR